MLYDQEPAVYATPSRVPAGNGRAARIPAEPRPFPHHSGTWQLPWSEPPAVDHPSAWHPPDEPTGTLETLRRPAPRRQAARRPRRMPTDAPATGGHTMSLLSHLGGVVTGFLVPTLCFLLSKERSPFTRLHSAEAFNFQLTLMLGYVGAAIIGVLFTGFLVLVPVWVVSLVFGIQAAVAAEGGHEYRYPWTVRFIE